VLGRELTGVVLTDAPFHIHDERGGVLARLDGALPVLAYSVVIGR